MYIYKDGKLYVQKGKDIVGVNISPTDVVVLEETKTKLEFPYEQLMPFEVRAKFNIKDGNDYKFPLPNKKQEQEPKVEQVSNEDVAPKEFREEPSVPKPKGRPKSSQNAKK